MDKRYEQVKGSSDKNGQRRSVTYRDARDKANEKQARLANNRVSGSWRINEWCRGTITARICCHRAMRPDACPLPIGSMFLHSERASSVHSVLSAPLPSLNWRFLCKCHIWFRLLLQFDVWSHHKLSAWQLFSFWITTILVHSEAPSRSNNELFLIENMIFWKMKIGWTFWWWFSWKPKEKI